MSTTKREVKQHYIRTPPAPRKLARNRVCLLNCILIFRQSKYIYYGWYIKDIQPTHSLGCRPTQPNVYHSPTAQLVCHLFLCNVKCIKGNEGEVMKRWRKTESVLSQNIEGNSRTKSRGRKEKGYAFAKYWGGQGNTQCKW